jgi:hypothetical protein
LYFNQHVLLNETPSGSIQYFIFKINALMKTAYPATVSWLFILIACNPLTAQYDYKWQTDGTVNTTVIANNTLYIGGTFSYAGQYTGNLAVLDNNTGLHDPSWPVVNGDVNTIVPDGSGGWYIGGAFTLVGGQNLPHIAHINNDKTVDAAWRPNVNSGVLTMILSGTTLYIGGNFTMVGAQGRNYIAAIDVTTAAATAWNPHADAPVNTIVMTGTTIYAGGIFSTMGGQTRNRLAAIDVPTGNVTAWNPNVTANATTSVRTLAIAGNTLYIGGFFLNVLGQVRNNAAAVDIPSGNLLAWDPAPDQFVMTLSVSGSTVYIGGAFNTIAGQTRRRIAALDATTGLATDWDPNANNYVTRMEIVGSTMYVAGAFSSIGGQTRRKLATLDLTVNTSNALPWNPNAGNGWEASSLTVSGSLVLTGGSFTSVNGQYRNNLAAIDLATNMLKSWNPNANNNVNAISVSGATVYAGGDFTMMTGQSRNRIAAIDATGTATAWNPGADGSVRALVVSITGDTVYAGGDFNNIGGQTRTKIAAIKASINTNNALLWDAAANGTVRALALQKDTVYAGGDFTSIGAQPRNRIAALYTNVQTANATTWIADANNTVRALTVANGVLYAGGDFTILGAQSRNRIASIGAGGVVTAWNPGADGAVRAIATIGSIVYIAGDFSNTGGQQRRRIAALDAGTNTNNALAWQPFISPGFTFNTVAVSGNIVYAGGSYVMMNADRSFYLTYMAGLDILPVRANRLVVKQHANNCYISWAADQPKDAQVEVQRSSNGFSYTAIAQPATALPAVHELADMGLQPGAYYYRLRTVYSSGMVQYSNIVRVVIGLNDNKIQIPSLVNRSNPLSLQIDNENNVLFLVNNKGQVVMRQALHKGNNIISWPSLAAGVYYYSIRNGGQQVQTGKIFFSAIQ